MKVTKIPKFRRFVLQNFPFIEQDFDALTDYALICKVVEYLNKVISQTNANTEQVAELSEAFNNLENYVEHYFDNLDVQTEINNKLDSMVEDGTLQEIIDTYLNTTTVWGFDTVAEMKSAENLANGSYARTMGFHSLNDGGKALYKIRTATELDTPNEMDMISIGDGSLVAILMENKNVNIKQLGAYGDNVHDDKTILQHAIDTYDVIYFPYGNYLISDGLTASRSIILKGDSKLSLPYNGSFIHMTKANTTLLAGNNNATHIDLESMGFVSTSSSVTVDEDLHVRPSEPYNPYHYTETVAGCNGVSATKKLKVTNCYFTGFSGYAVQANANAMITDTWISHSNNGIRVNGYDPIITRPYITLCKNGIYMVSGSSSSIFMYDIWIDQIVEYGIRASGIIGIINGIIDHVGYCGIYATGNCKVNLDMRIGRCGMYYASVVDPTTITNEDMIYACSMYLTNIVDSQVKVTYEYRDIGTSTSATAYMLPKCVLFVKQFIRSLFTAMNVDSSVELIRVTNYNNSNGTIITQEGIKKWDSATRQFVDIYELAS